MTANREQIERASIDARERLNGLIRAQRDRFRRMGVQQAHIEAARRELGGRASGLPAERLLRIATRRVVMLEWLKLRDALIEGERRRARKRFARAAARWMGRDLAERTLLKWEGRFARGGLAALMNDRGRPPGTLGGRTPTPIDQELWAALCRLVDSGVSAKAAYEQVSRRHQSGWWPSLRTIQKRLRERDNETGGGDAGHSKDGAPSVVSADGVAEPLRLVTSSSTGAPPR